ncbi:DUF2442 domain-containing protein [Candidatus Latescibacterota bacterium]
MYWDIIDMSYVDGYRLQISFKDGSNGVVDFSSYADRGGVFSSFSDMDFFRRVFIDHGVLCWPGDVDIAPETIYSLATGKPLPEWVED